MDTEVNRTNFKRQYIRPQELFIISDSRFPPRCYVLRTHWLLWFVIWNYEFLTRNADVLSEAVSFYDVKSSHVHFAESLLLNYLLVADPDITLGHFTLVPIGIVDVKRDSEESLLAMKEDFTWPIESMTTNQSYCGDFMLIVKRIPGDGYNQTLNFIKCGIIEIHMIRHFWQFVSWRIPWNKSKLYSIWKHVTDFSPRWPGEWKNRQNLFFIWLKICLQSVENLK